MKTKIWTNKVELLKLFYPSIVSWATDLDYNIPSVSTLAKYCVKFLECKTYDSTYNGETIQAIGTHYANIQSIKIASLRDQFEIMSTLIHEFAHAIQYFSMGEKFHIKYRMASSTKAHSENQYEDEARALEAKLFDRIRRDTIFCEDIEHFVFEFEKQKDPPKPKPAKFEAYYYPIWREAPWYTGYAGRKQWWNN